MSEKDLAGLLRFCVDAATLVWQGPAAELDRATVLCFGAELDGTALPLGDQGELRCYGQGRFAIVHRASGMAQLRRDPRSQGGLTRLDRLIGDLAMALVRRP